MKFLSEKSDVYSFGVLVLEIISGQRNSNFNQSDAVELLSYVSNGKVVGFKTNH